MRGVSRSRFHISDLVFRTPRAFGAMTDEEFEQLKEAEKEHLRAKERLRSTLDALKRRNRVQSVVRRMQRGAERLLDETEALVNSLHRSVARGEAKMDLSLDEQAGEEVEQEQREARAEALLRQYKAAQSSSVRGHSGGDKEGEPDGDSSPDGPEKTIGRMRRPRSNEDDSS